MRIAIVAHDLIRGDGMGRVNSEIAKCAIERGHHVTALTDRIDPDLTARGAAYVKIHPRIQRPGIFDVRLFSHLADRQLKARAGQFDRILGNGYTLTQPHDLNICAFVHGSWIRSPVHTIRVRRGPYAWYQWMYSWMNWSWELKSFRAARRIITPSKLAADELISIGVPASKIGVIFNGVDVDEFQPGPADRAALGLPLDVPLALFAGDIQTPRKNLDTVLRALERVEGVHLAVVGRLPGSPYPAMAEQLGVADRVHFLGFRRDVAALFKAVDLFVFPSRYDTFALVVLEAMASGVPTITVPSTGASELMDSSSGTVLPDAEDVPALADAMRRYLGDPALRRSVATAGRNVATRNTWSIMAAQYLELMEKPT